MSKPPKPTTVIRYERVPISSLIRDSANPRAITPKSKGRLRASIKRFGLVQPVVVSERDGRRLVVGGHQRLDALEASGATEVDVAVGCWSAADERALNVTLNNPANQGEFSGGLEAYLDSIAGGLNALDFLSLGLADLLPSADNDASGYQDRMAEVEELDTSAINGARFEIRIVGAVADQPDALAKARDALAGLNVEIHVGLAAHHASR